jgi:hypothetical protein
LKQELMLTIVTALNQRFPGEDRTSKQDRSDLAQEYFGVPAYADLKSLPLGILQEGYARLTRPIIGQGGPPPVDDEDVPDHPPPVEGRIGPPTRRAHRALG